MPTNEERIVAVTSPRSIGKMSMFETKAAITQETVGEFRSEESDTQGSCDELIKLGFAIENVSPITISFSGTRKQFQDAFGVKLHKEKVEVMEGLQVDTLAASDEDAARLLQPPEALSKLIEGVAIASPPELYASPLPPLAQPDPAAYRYLFVPDELAVVTRAARVHRLGVTGRDIVVAMIDTGHYRHPFFNWHGYRILQNLLGPGQGNAADDSSGHGTGESANIFSAAPDIRLRPIKGLVDPTGDFNVAVSSSPTPQVISNSWGYNIDNRTWSQWKTANLNFYNYLKTLEAAVANAVASGIVVCFSAGNGQYGFPGSHPDVISVGGVHINYPDLDLEASNYASSFDSKLYPGRHVPDFCGATGKRATIGGSIRAPSHMLPVQPGSSLDAISPSTGASDDGWGLFSGTSAACPLVAGIVALLLEKNTALTPAKVKEILAKSARDVKTGTSAMGDAAGPGIDAATGSGFADAKWAYLISMGDVAAEFVTASPEKQAEMIAAGQMPKVPKEFVTDIVETLRSS